jgi:hypothetical protein
LILDHEKRVVHRVVSSVCTVKIRFAPPVLVCDKGVEIVTKILTKGYSILMFLDFKEI